MMSSALKMPSRHMSLAEFLDWNPDEGSGALWQLRDGEPEMMAPASDRHGSIQAELTALVINHLDSRGGPCRVVIAPGVVPRLRSAENCRVPGIAVTCAPASGAHILTDPVVLIEILSPSNEPKTRANVWAYSTIPSVAEIVVLRTSSVIAEVLRRQSDGSWPAQPEMVGSEGELRLDSIGFATPLRLAYRTAGLEQAAT
jgi:Uma2 family endonuclease